MDLAQYRQSSSFKASHDGSFANKAVLLCSQVLASTVCSELQPSQEQWDSLLQEADAWEASIPTRFKPYFTEDTCSGERKRKFPTILHTKPAHGKVMLTPYSRTATNYPTVLGYQHFYVARIALKVFKPGNWKPDFEAFQKRVRAQVEASLFGLFLISG